MANEQKAPNASDFRDVLDCFGFCNEGKLIALVSGLTNAELTAVGELYHQEFKRDLINDIKSKTKQDFERVMVASCMNSAEYDAHCLHEAFGGIGSDKTVLTEILCTRTTQQLEMITAAYAGRYKKVLRDRIVSESSGALKAIYCLMIDGKRDPNTNPDVVLSNATILGRSNVDEKKLVQVLAGHCREHAVAVKDVFLKTNGCQLESVIKKKCSSDVRDALIACCTPVAEFCADRLLVAFNETGVDDTSMIRIILTHKETLLKEISAALLKKSGKDLRAWVNKKGHHKEKLALIAMLAHFCPAQ